MQTPQPPAWRQAPHLVRQVGEGLMVLAAASEGEPVLLEGTARLVWDCLVDPVTVGELAADFVEHFSAPVDQVRDDIQALIDQLGAELLVEEV